MLHIALYQPEIPPNTGNIIRLCANTGAQLHLIHPLGFAWEDKQLQRASLDYQEWAEVKHHQSFQEFLEQTQAKRIFACSTKGNTCYSDIIYQDEDIFLFGPETRGLPASIRKSYQALYIPMLPSSRSLNLSNAAAICLFEAWRQLGYGGASCKLA